jgi:hypothetical protein
MDEAKAAVDIKSSTLVRSLPCSSLYFVESSRLTVCLVICCNVGWKVIKSQFKLSFPLELCFFLYLELRRNVVMNLPVTCCQSSD